MYPPIQGKQDIDLFKQGQSSNNWGLLLVSWKLMFLLMINYIYSPKKETDF